MHGATARRACLRDTVARPVVVVANIVVATATSAVEQARTWYSSQRGTREW